MDAPATLETARSVSQAVRKDFFDRYNGVVVKETFAFGHPTTQRMFRRTFTVAAKNFYFAAVVAPMLLRDREDKLTEIERFLRDNLAKARKGFEAELEQVRAIARDAGISEVGSFSKPSPQEVRLVTPSSNDHLKLFKLADELLHAGFDELAHLADCLDGLSRRVWHRPLLDLASGGCRQFGRQGASQADNAPSLLELLAAHLAGSFITDFDANFSHHRDGALIHPLIGLGTCRGSPCPTFGESIQQRRGDDASQRVVGAEKQDGGRRHWVSPSAAR